MGNVLFGEFELLAGGHRQAQHSIDADKMRAELPFAGPAVLPLPGGKPLYHL
jgi:hypothetical protein